MEIQGTFLRPVEKGPLISLYYRIKILVYVTNIVLSIGLITKTGVEEKCSNMQNCVTDGTHGDKDATHGGKDGTHGDKDGTHGDKDGTHGDKDGTHGDKDETHGDKDAFKIISTL